MLARFARHRVAANLLMLLLLLAGLFGLRNLNTQFFPTFDLDIVTVQVVWSGASAEDVERSILLPVEQELRAVNGIDTLYATASQGMASFRVELEEGTDVDYALTEVRQKIDAIRADLPTDSEEPLVQKVIRYEGISDVILTSDRASLQELRPLAYRLEQALLEQGVRKIDFIGLPEQEIAIQVPPEQLQQLGLTLHDIAGRIRQQSLDLPAGTAARDEGARQIRSLGQQRDAEGFRQLPLLADDQGRLVRVGDIAQVSQRPRDEPVLLSWQGQPAVMLQLKRTESDDTLVAAEILNRWLAETRPTLPEGTRLIAFNESWQLINDRIQLLIKNGVSGLILVVLILFLFLNARVAFWVSVGIPVSLMTALAVLWGIGGSINMMSLFAFIMALGIIVDDAIVVGEDTLTHVQRGEPGLQAAIGGATRMAAPVVASSLTTIAAFLPLLLVGGIIGNILIDIPTVVICVILASLLECLLILPGHLSHSLRSVQDLRPSALRQRLDAGFERLREQHFRPFVTLALRHRGTTLACALGLLIVGVGLIAGGRLQFTFFPSVDTNTLTANVKFVAGTPATQVDRFLAHLDQTLARTDAALGGGLVKVALRESGMANFPRSSATAFTGEAYGSLYVELIPADSREVRNQTLIEQWRARIQLPAGIEKFSIDLAQAGPPGKPIEIKLTGPDVGTLKQASIALQDTLSRYAGLSNIDDDLPWGRSQLIFSLTPAARAAGLQLETLGQQLRAAFDGLPVQTFYAGRDEIEVRVMLPDARRDHLSTLSSLPIVLPDGRVTPIGNVVEFQPRPGLDSLQRIDGQLALNVSADLDEAQTNADEVIARLQAEALPSLTSRFGVQASFEGKNRDQRETLADMKAGLVLALALIYIILAWVFGAWSWPLVVMLAIPLGLTGAIFGHLLTGQDLTVLSLFGLFGLSGIVINDSIVLVTFYKSLRDKGMAVQAAITEAACQRLRAVLLTSLTTIGGLTPILFETSLQARFLIPMATSIVFGLAYGTLLILVVVPAMLSVLEELNPLRRTTAAGQPSIEKESRHET
ncbi:efflux RND transporter permease subunit [Marinobacterium weihaiense]|uniref:Efflux RND transporter permease subunit n=1 Tax=Marinobacterium weihaiense TaxID=2851016 RepID=A0ABS6M8K1_9GAMM|nr:efflux RND transporter permease subunit [Marinobacterium weihaiense]MBV0932616.1 efflux RND transporter permease subunit [Marinobacterium weihaiense]